MKAETEKAITLLAEKITKDTPPDAALKYTQAALNLSHVLATLHNMKQ